MICTGISQIILGCSVFALCFILSDRRSDDFGEIFQTGAAYWGAIPIVITGFFGVAGGCTGKFTVTCLFLAAAVISCFLGGILAAFVGVALTARRSVGECENVYCPYDTESILMIALISVLILQAALALSGVIESSQLLCCTVEEDHVSVVSIGNSARDQRKQRLRSERVTQKLKKDGFFAASYDTSFDDASTRFYGFRNGKKGYRMCELGTTV